jgi:hypothetical protein
MYSAQGPCISKQRDQARTIALLCTTDMTISEIRPNDFREISPFSRVHDSLDQNFTQRPTHACSTLCVLEQKQANVVQKALCNLMHAHARHHVVALSLRARVFAC